MKIIFYLSIIRGIYNGSWNFKMGYWIDHPANFNMVIDEFTLIGRRAATDAGFLNSFSQATSNPDLLA